MKIICTLPTGDWSEVNAENLPRFVSVSDEVLRALADGEITIDEIEEA